MEKSDDCGQELQKKRRMRNNRNKRRRQQRAITKRASASEAVAQQFEESVRQQKALTDKYIMKWRKITQEGKNLKARLHSHRQQHIRQVIYQWQ